jgi:type I restriction enzyme M protein
MGKRRGGRLASISLIAAGLFGLVVMRRRSHRNLTGRYELGTLVDRTRKEFSDSDIARIATIYHAWRGEKGAGKYENIAGFCKAATLAEISTVHNYALTPGRYVGSEEIEDDGEPFKNKMTRLVGEVHAQFFQSAKLEQAIKANLKGWAMAVAHIGAGGGSV